MDPHEDVTSTGVISASLLPRTAVDETAEALAVTDSVSFAVAPAVLTSIGNLDDYIDGAGFLFVQDVGTVSASAYPSARVFPMLVAETIRATDRLFPRVTIDTVDGGAVTGVAVGDVVTLLVSTGTVSAAATPSTTSRPILYSTAQVSASVAGFKVLDLTDTGSVSASLHPVTAVQALLTSTGAVSASVDLRAGVVELATSSGTLSASVAAQATLYALLVDHVEGWGSAHAEGSVAWTAGTDNWAGSRYTPYDFRSLAVFRGELYAAGQPGLVKIGADKDAGADVAARVESHLTDFGEKGLKLPRALYVGYTSNQALTVTMSATDDGQETAYDYTAPPRLADTFVPDRIALGRGLRSRYLRFILANESGGDFVIDGAYIDADVSERRV